VYIQRCAESRVGNKCEFEYQPTNSTDATIFGIWIVANFNETDIMWLKQNLGKPKLVSVGFHQTECAVGGTWTLYVCELCL